MKTRKFFAIGAAATLLLLPLSGLSLSSAEAAGTGLSLTLTGGTISISAPATKDLGSVTSSSSGSSLVAQIGNVVVTDDRAAAAGAGWVASAISTAFTPATGPTIPASSISYSAGTVAVTGTATCTDNDPSSLTGVSAVVTATAITGSNVATWNPTLTIAIPGSLVAGVYTATITHSVS